MYDVYRRDLQCLYTSDNAKRKSDPYSILVVNARMYTYSHRSTHRYMRKSLIFIHKKLHICSAPRSVDALKPPAAGSADAPRGEAPPRFGHEEPLTRLLVRAAVAPQIGVLLHVALSHVLVGLAGVVAAEVGAVVELARAELVVVDLDGEE